MKKVAILIHGFNVFNPELTVGKLRPFLEYQGYEVQMFRYGWMGLWGARTRNRKLAARLAQLTRGYAFRGYEVHVFSHSNGGTIQYIAQNEYHAIINGVVCINPALKMTLHPCRGAKFAHVYYNDNDLPVKLGKWLRWFTPLARSARPWGEMGRCGYLGSHLVAPSVQSFDTEKGFSVPAKGHSGVFKDPAIDFFGEIIAVMANPGGIGLTL